jgi:hypothetical protein
MNTKMRRILVRLYFFITGLGLFLVLSGTVLVVSAQNPPPSTASIPVVNVQGAKVPDWQKITFENLPGINTNGGFQANAAIVQQLGYDPSRQWSQGQKPSSFVALGDFQNSFDLQNFDLSQIGQASQSDNQSAGLEKFGVMPFQDLRSLVKAVSGLGAFPINQVPPVRDLIAQSVGSFDASQTIDQLLAKAPHLGDLSFANLDLSQYSIADIPNLEITQLAAFQNWQAVKIEDIPGLPKVPWSNFPNAPEANGQTVGKVDVVFGAAEHARTRSISGSTVEGFGVPCDTGCGHIELSGNSVLGRQWDSGKYQEVRGGLGTLGSVNGGKEPTGRHPFGEAFKLVLWDVSEPQATASMAMFFRVCARGTPDLGCTPYFMGAVPLMTVRENEPIFLGRVTNDKSSNPSTPTPVALQELEESQQELKQGAKSSPEANSSKANSSNKSFTNSSQQSTNRVTLRTDASCTNKYSVVTLDALSSAIAAVESGGDSGAVGAFTCDNQGNCGRALGDKQFMSYRDEVRTLVGSKPGGTEFLKDLDSGKTVSSEQLLQYFSPTEQQQLFNADSQRLITLASSQIDPTTGQPFAGERLIERVAQMHLGGAAVEIDSRATDINDKSVKAYGESVSENYKQATDQMGCS